MLDGLADKLGKPKTFVLVDDSTKQHVLPCLSSKAIDGAQLIAIGAGEESKTLDSLSFVWQQLGENGATRSSLLINLGGGVVTDLGGFAAATYMRGMRCINVPTTLLAAVDAAVGGKTGINFNGYKNQIGAFFTPFATVISTEFFHTLDAAHLLSGYAEMLKHALLTDDKMLARLLMYDIEAYEDDTLLPLLEESIAVKTEIAEKDFRESSLRKVLNLGHTVGHAFEALDLKRNGTAMPHGYAVAAGLVVELILSHMTLGFSSETLYRLANYVYEKYDSYDVCCDDYPLLIEAMQHDKKNISTDRINFTLLRAVGVPEINHYVSPQQIEAALDIYRDLMRM